jgi:hypothetical protein
LTLANTPGGLANPGILLGGEGGADLGAERGGWALAGVAFGGLDGFAAGVPLPEALALGLADAFEFGFAAALELGFAATLEFGFAAAFEFGFAAAPDFGLAEVFGFCPPAAQNFWRTPFTLSSGVVPFRYPSCSIAAWPAALADAPALRMILAASRMDFESPSFFS